MDFCEAISWIGALEEELEKAEQDRDSWERIAIGYYEDHNACPGGWCDCTQCNFTALQLKRIVERQQDDLLRAGTRGDRYEQDLKDLSDRVWAYMLEVFGDPGDFPQWVHDYARNEGE